MFIIILLLVEIGYCMVDVEGENRWIAGVRIHVVCDTGYEWTGTSYGRSLPHAGYAGRRRGFCSIISEEEENQR